ncbi:WD domain, G-beta repeat [Geosmithia morbida]|uniref:Mitochondrial division protein 1 n=1 Tax=Geosmithia morbida TaxID=1094350 RepID=A0A9P4YNS8_9HYPO|nr:WD domain, G-beta repeat [Geosmithia morbida]KAF4119290.1 WD domain, G-beta repeat [Geosmithia morbida]
MWLAGLTVHDTSLTLRVRRVVSRSEITQVRLSRSWTALAVYAVTLRSPQSWVDVFSLSPPPYPSSSSSPSSLSVKGSNGGRGRVCQGDSSKSLSKTCGSQAAFSPDTRRVATLRDWTTQLGSGAELHYATSILIRDTDSGRTTLEIEGICAGGPLCWSPDGRWIIAATADGSVGGGAGAGSGGHRLGVWDSRSGSRAGRGMLGHVDRVTHSAVTTDRTVVSLSRDASIRLTNPLTGRTVARLEMDAGGGGAGSAAPAVMTAANNLLAVGEDGENGGSVTVAAVWGGSRVVLWHPYAPDATLTSYALPSVRSVEGWPLTISSDAKYLVCRTEDGFDVTDLATGALLCQAVVEEVVTAACFSPDSSVVLIGRMDGVVEAWDFVRRGSDAGVGKN